MVDEGKLWTKTGATATRTHTATLLPPPHLLDNLPHIVVAASTLRLMSRQVAPHKSHLGRTQAQTHTHATLVETHAANASSLEPTPNTVEVLGEAICTLVSRQRHHSITIPNCTPSSVHSLCDEGNNIHAGKHQHPCLKHVLGCHQPVA